MNRFLLTLYLLISLNSLAQVELVKDINSSGSSFEFNEKIVVFDAKLFFPANDGINGNEIWVSDGTTAGTTLLKDIYPGVNNSSPLYLTATDSRVYFRALTDNAGAELWYTDGTSSGTLINTDLIPGAVGAAPTNFYAANDNLYYIADNPAGEGRELFITNTSSLANVLTNFPNSNINSLVATSFKDSLIYATPSVPFDDPFGFELYYATPTTTNLLKDLDPGSQNTFFNELKTISEEVYFFADTTFTASNFDLWKTDGTEAGTLLIKEMPGNSAGSMLTLTDNGLIYFIASAPGIGPELWVTDGTENGTSLVKAINPLNTSTGSSINTITSAGNKIFFAARDGLSGNELWLSDGTEAGTTLVKDINVGPSFGLEGTNSSMVWFNERLYFAADDGTNGKELWLSDGTEAGTMLLEDINPGSASSDPKNFVVFDGSIYFVATDATSGRELRKYTPEVANTISGSVTDFDSGNPLNKVSLENISQNETIQTDGNGKYSIEAAVEDTIVFTLNDYVPDSIIVVDGQLVYNVQLQFNPCYDIFCGFGETCFEGVCYPVIEGTVTHESTGNPLEGVSIENIKRGTSSTTATDGSYVISAATGDSVIYSLEAYNNDTVVVASGVSSYDISLTPIDPCTDVFCDFGKICVNGQCVDPCSTIECADNEFCENGTCISKNPCEGVFCPFGQVCYEGSCYDPVVSGKVKNQQQIPLDNVLIYHIEHQDSLYSDAGGNFIINESGNYLFYKVGYVAKTMYLNQGIINIILSNDSCEGVNCPFGQICYAGSCYDPETSYNFSFIVKDVIDQQAIQNIKVSPLNNYNNVVETGVNGEASISVTDQSQIIFRDSTGFYNELIINPSTQVQEIYLSRSDCDGVFCPFGELCFAGSCYDPINSDQVLKGYAFDADSMPLNNVYVSIGIHQTTTNSSGYFELEVPSNLDSLFVTTSKTGFGTFEFEMFKNQFNEIYLYVDDACFNIICPFGQVCYEGSCYESVANDPNPDLCEGVYCPFGQVCYNGSCYEPCEENGPGICSGTLTDTCDSVECPFGQICEDGVCYDPCIEESDPNNLCYNSSLDQCENINLPPGYICIEGVVVPDCPNNTLACAAANICNVVSCPPGDVCFQCDRTNIGSSKITGQINLRNISSGRTSASYNSNIFIFLTDLSTSEKISIARSDSEGKFTMENIPAGEYKVTGSFRGYYMQDMTLQVGELEDIELTFSSNDRFLEMQQSRITQILEIENETSKKWFPSPNYGQTFHIKNELVSELKIFTLQGQEVNNQRTFTETDAVTILSIDTPLQPGLYLFMWKNSKETQLKTQTILIKK